MLTKGEATKKMIIDASAILFSKKGFKDVSMTDICDATNLSRGGLYRHFSSTSEIFTLLISTERSFDERIKANESALYILKSALDELEKEILDPERSLSLAIYEFASIDENKKLFAAWYCDDYREFIPSAYEEKYLDFEAFPLRYSA